MAIHKPRKTHKKIVHRFPGLNIEITEAGRAILTALDHAGEIEAVTEYTYDVPPELHEGERQAADWYGV
jgi:hypothetical protein